MSFWSDAFPSLAIRSGLHLAGLFGWLLSFPMFGRFLFAGGGEAAPVLGLIFVFAHGAGLLLLWLLPDRQAVRPLLIRTAGVTVAVLTLTAHLVLPGPLLGGAALMAVLGLGAAFLVLAWVPDWMACGNRLAALAVAMAGANLIVALVNLPFGLPPGLGLALLAILALGISFDIGTSTGSPAGPPAVTGGIAGGVSSVPGATAGVAAVRGAVIGVAAFALADYFVGGIWYNILAASIQAAWAWQASAEAVIYAAAILLLFLAVRARQSGELALYSLSALGLGLLMAASGATGGGLVFAFRGILLFGLAAGDLFYWDRLGRLGLTFGARRAMGVGLGVSLMLIGLAIVGAERASPGPGGPGLPFLLVGAALLFLVIPLVFRSVVGESPARPAPAPTLPVLPELLLDLTQAERQVYGMLVAGATDQEIAAKLIISKHTVKFHVRNILHKAGVANRKELLSRLVTEGAAAAMHEDRPET
ncbi:MAG TPA: helix-turn-helix transcriptional regulator [Symbiobacteriaceae bacterium]